MENSYPDPTRRAMIVGSTMLASIMATLDATVANIALPHIQSSLSASPEQVIWVVTSYVVAQAIATPLAGWLATRFGRRNIMAGSIFMFTIASVACGLAATLPALVVFRFVQGVFGAATVPLSQATLLDTYPPNEYGKAMAFYGLGSMFGGVAGPVVGGVLTEYLSWRWIFLINLPVGLLTSAALFTFLPANRPEKSRFDIFGFAALSIALASFQLMIDRGAQLDWFDSTEVWGEAVVAVVALYVFFVHIATSRDPYIKPALFRNRNFLIGIIVATGLGILVFGALPIFGTMLQTMLGFPVLLAGMMMAPRSIGTAVSMFIAGKLMERFDARFILFGAIALTGWAFYMMSGMSLETDREAVIISGFLMGVGAGLLFVPLSTMAFTTLPVALRNEGTAMVALFRFIGTSVGISLLQMQMLRNAAVVQSRLTEGIRPDSPQVNWALPGFDFDALGQLAGLYRQIARQAMMVAYIDTYWMMFVLSVAMMPLALLMKRPRHAEPVDVHAIARD
ncbi:MAG: DHA2 family efflux MFS transporter permease subunit [Novosphingobium sp.]